ncbi:MAG: DNA cytosine methyltransferase, partial [Chloroflexota bacterium]|nr:DNA cytosine methyltransferase [Chloroflexota bacterium]
MQLPLFGEESLLPRERRKIGTGANGAKDAASRYVGLKAKLNLDPLNQNWRVLDTRDVSGSPTNLNYIDLFSGAGGMSVGFRQAGLHKIFSVEVDADASATIRRNFPESTHFEGPIEAVTDALLNR